MCVFYSVWDGRGSWCSKWFSIDTWTCGVLCYKTLGCIGIFCVGMLPLTVLLWWRGGTTSLLQVRLRASFFPTASIVTWGRGSSLFLLWVGRSSGSTLSSHGYQAAREGMPHSLLHLTWTNTIGVSLLLQSSDEIPDAPLGLFWYLSCRGRHRITRDGMKVQPLHMVSADTS